MIPLAHAWTCPTCQRPTPHATGEPDAERRPGPLICLNCRTHWEPQIDAKGVLTCAQVVKGPERAGPPLPDGAGRA